MSVTLINGDGNPRVLASQDADWYGALTGEKTCIVPINDNLSATITDSNTVEIGSGVCITKEGRRVQIDEGDIEEIIIPTGTQGVDTYYIIGFHLYINESGQQVAETFVETMSSATDIITETTFKEGSSSIYVSLYRVKRSGLLMDSVTQIIPTLKTIVDINDTLGSTDISAIGDGTVTGGLSRLNSDLTAVSASLTELGKVTTMSNSHGYMSNIQGGYSVIGKIVVVGGRFTPTSDIPMRTAIGGRFPVPIAGTTPIKIFDGTNGTYIDGFINSSGDLVNLTDALTSGQNVYVSGAYLKH
jgi:hypothetical protein